ncbi:MAG: DUF4348 domain-containing protein [Flavobacteriaceae bacterium]|nr:DUF4348 domain-containing protein [Flavobacteriaceae bacterium]
MNNLYILLIVLFFFSCKKYSKSSYKINENKIEITKKERNSLGQEKTSLSNEKFNTFFIKFRNDSIFQKKRLEDIIYLYSLYDTDKIEVIKYKKRDISFMDFRDDSLAYKKKYDKYKIETVKKKDSITYSMYGIDNGINQHYVFKRGKSNKWYLISIHDYSN